MALVKCKECGVMISSGASKCPHCGKRRTGLLTKIIAVFLGFSVLGAVVSGLNGGNHANVGTTSNPAAASVASPPKLSADDERRIEAGAALIQLKNAMRNPKSFELIRVLQMPSGVVCYEYRAQNGFGGMNVERAALVKDRISMGTSESSEAVWDARCAGKTGRNITAELARLLE